MSFIKLHASILDSSVWLEDDKTVRVWIALMAMANRDGVVEASVPGLAHRARVSRKATDRALEIFTAPDVDSRTPTDDGRRIEKVAGGWRLINYHPYRDKASPADVREKAAARQRAWRERNAVTPVITLRNAVTCDVTPGDTGNDIGEADGEGSGSPSALSSSPSSRLPDPDQTRDPSAPRTAYELTSLFGVMWGKRYGRMWLGQQTAAKPATQFMDRTEAEREALAPMILPALERFLADERGFYVERGHAFDVFLRDFDVHTGRAPPRRGDVRVGHAMAEVKPRADGLVKL